MLLLRKVFFIKFVFTQKSFFLKVHKYNFFLFFTLTFLSAWVFSVSLTCAFFPTQSPAKQIPKRDSVNSLHDFDNSINRLK